MITSKPIILAIALVAMPICAPGASDRPLYMWVDENGVVNFSQDKPKGMEVEEFHGRPALRPGPTVDQQKQAEAESKDKPPNVTEIDEAEIEAANAKARMINCEIGQRMLEKLNEHKFAYMQDEEGWWRRLSPEQQAAQVQKANDLIAENCPPE